MYYQLDEEKADIWALGVCMLMYCHNTKQDDLKGIENWYSGKEKKYANTRKFKDF